MKKYEDDRSPREIERPQRLSEFLFPELAKTKQGKKVTDNVIMDTWAKVMDDQARSHVKVIGIDGKKILLSTSELHWYRVLQKNTGSVIDRINSHLDSRVIEEVVIVFKRKQDL